MYDMHCQPLENGSDGIQCKFESGLCGRFPAIRGKNHTLVFAQHDMLARKIAMCPFFVRPEPVRSCQEAASTVNAPPNLMRYMTSAASFCSFADYRDCSAVWEPDKGK